jgi:hypothetical protein
MNRRQKEIFDKAMHSMYWLWGKRVVAPTFKMKARWNPAVSEDLKAFHGIDVVAEQTKKMANDLAKSIDEKILEGFKK